MTAIMAARILIIPPTSAVCDRQTPGDMFCWKRGRGPEGFWVYTFRATEKDRSLDSPVGIRKSRGPFCAPITGEIFVIFTSMSGKVGVVAAFSGDPWGLPR